MKTIYYGWIIVGVGVLVKMAGLGFGRFAYPMLLPDMREPLLFRPSGQKGFPALKSWTNFTASDEKKG